MTVKVMYSNSSGVELVSVGKMDSVGDGGTVEGKVGPVVPLGEEAVVGPEKLGWRAKSQRNLPTYSTG